MLLGFMSLILAVTQVPISNICIPNRLADIMLPCRKQAETPATTVENVEHLVVGLARTFLPTSEIYNRTVWKVPHRRLADDDDQAADDGGGATTGTCGEVRFFLLNYVPGIKFERIVDSDIRATYWSKIIEQYMELNLQGKASLVSEAGLHQLHIFIFVLAVMQIVYSVLTMGLGRAKVRTLCATKISPSISMHLIFVDSFTDT